MIPNRHSDHNFVGRTIWADDLFDPRDKLGRDKLRTIDYYSQVRHDKVIITAGDTPTNIYIPSSGRVVIVQSRYGDHVTFNCRVSPDLIYGLVEALSGDTFDFEMVMLAPGEFYTIPYSDFLGMIHEQPADCFRLAKILGGLYQKTIGNIRSL